MDMKNWNVDKTQIAAQQEGLKKSMNFAYVGHGPKATGFMAKQFKRKPGLYARCVQCGYYMPLDAALLIQHNLVHVEPVPFVGRNTSR